MKEKNKYDIIDKGYYNHPQNNDSVHIKQYIIARKDEKKCLFLRFLNTSNLRIKGLELVLTQMNFSGDIICSVPVRLNKISVDPGDVFTSNCGIVIDDKCTDFKIDVVALSSGGYRYYESNGKMIASYEPAVNDRHKSKNYGRMSSQSARLTSSKSSAVVAAVIIIVMILIYLNSALSEFGKF